MKLYYRISDSSYNKPKLIGATKKACLINFVKCFHKVIFNGPTYHSNKLPLTIIADNCNEETLDFLNQLDMPVIRTNYGNAGSLIHSLKIAISESLVDEEIVYFCEDDYLHLPKSPLLLEEGIKRSDYITLYDHPDKYRFEYSGGEFSKVIKTNSSHWRYTVSTCMTFGTTIGKLKEDISIWEKHTEGSHPHDHHIFSELKKEKSRRLIVPIPGVACHTDLEYSGRCNEILIDSWAIDLMISKLKSEISDLDEHKEWLEDKIGWNLLVALDSIKKSKANDL